MTLTEYAKEMELLVMRASNEGISIHPFVDESAKEEGILLEQPKINAQIKLIIKPEK